MISNMASCIVDALIRNKVIDIQSTSVYQYGFEIFISSVLTILITITSGILFHCLTAAMVYFILFVLLRSVCGGYHAKTYSASAFGYHQPKEPVMLKKSAKKK